MHLGNLAGVLEYPYSHGIQLKREKCLFMQPSVVYPGYVVDSQGLHTTKGKRQAIADAPVLTNIPELHSFWI